MLRLWRSRAGGSGADASMLIIDAVESVAQSPFSLFKGNIIPPLNIRQIKFLPNYFFPRKVVSFCKNQKCISEAGFVNIFHYDVAHEVNPHAAVNKFRQYYEIIGSATHLHRRVDCTSRPVKSWTVCDCWKRSRLIEQQFINCNRLFVFVFLP